MQGEYEWWVSYHSWVEIQLKGHKIRDHYESFACALQYILLSCDTLCNSAVFHMTTHDIYVKSIHDLYYNYNECS